MGRIEPNERSLKTVTAWTGGRIDRLHINVTGDRVQAGRVVATLYSPEVFAAHQDLLVAKKQVDRLGSGPPASRQAAKAALDAARQRLRLLGVPSTELTRMQNGERPTRAVSVRSPFTGTIIERLATEGAYVSTGTPLYRVADLRKLWVQLDAYESDLARLSKGQQVRVSVQSLSSQVFEGKITFIDPTIDPQRRTARVRVEVDNGDGRLRPGMFAEAVVVTGPKSSGRSPLVVPATAPLFTGRRAIVYIEVGVQNGRVAYEPRQVRLGPRLGDVYPVVAGLNEGERVVTRGAFTLDADLQIRGGPSMMASVDGDDESVDAPSFEVTEAQRKRLAPVVEAYLAVQSALADDALAPARSAAARMVDAVRRTKLERPQAVLVVWRELAPLLRAHARHVASASTLEGARTAFEPLSEGIVQLLQRFGNPIDRPLRLAFCPMAVGSEGAFWIQQAEEIDNAYFGASMLTCGEVRQEIAPEGYLRPTIEPPPTTPASAPAKGHRH